MYKEISCARASANFKINSNELRQCKTQNWPSLKCRQNQTNFHQMNIFGLHFKSLTKINMAILADKRWLEEHTLNLIPKYINDTECRHLKNYTPLDIVHWNYIIETHFIQNFVKTYKESKIVPFLSKLNF